MNHNEIKLSLVWHQKLDAYGVQQRLTCLYSDRPQDPPLPAWQPTAISHSHHHHPLLPIATAPQPSPCTSLMHHMHCSCLIMHPAAFSLSPLAPTQPLSITASTHLCIQSPGHNLSHHHTLIWSLYTYSRPFSRSSYLKM